MNTIKYFVALLGLSAIMISCKKESLMMYNGDAYVQFGPDSSKLYNTTYDLADTLKSYTFYYDDAKVKEDTVYFDIYAIGGLSNKDRFFTLQQINLSDSNKAVAGVHYKSFTDADLSNLYVIRAGCMHAQVPVIMLRDTSLKNASVRLTFQVAESSDFKIGEAQKAWRKLDITDKLVKPLNWDNFRGTIGIYSTTRQKFMIDITGQRWDASFLTTVGADGAYLKYWMDNIKIALINYNKQHPAQPLSDENGAVVFP